MFIKLPYHIEEAGDGCNYQIFIDETYLDELKIPDEIKDRISSFGITMSPGFTYFNRTNDSLLMGEFICYKLKLILEKYWDLTYGIPYMEFSGYTRKLDDVFKHRPVLIFFTSGESDRDIAIWEQNISFLPKFEFIAELTDFGFSVMTTDIEFVRAWLSRKKFTLTYGPVNYKQTAEYKMQVWFRDINIRNRLMTIAKQHIDAFVIHKNFNIFIPEYAVIESYHIRRFKCVVDMFKTRFNVDLVMTLPMIVDDKEYTILFPVCGSLNRNNVRGH